MNQASRNPMTTEELFKHHAVFVAKFLRRLGVRQDAIDDAVQDVFMVVHRNGGYTPGAAKPTSYLATIAVHAAATCRRRERLATVRAGSHAVDELAASTADSAQSVETQQRLRTLQEALSRLDLSLQQTLILADGEGETCVSIAAAMEVPLGTVYWRLSHARKKFRHALRSVQAAELCRRPSQAEPAPRSRAWSLAAIFGIEWQSAPDIALLRADHSDRPSGYDVAGGLHRLREFVRASPPMPTSVPALPGRPLWGSSVGGSVAVGAGLMVLGLAASVILPQRSRSEAEQHREAAALAPAHTSPVADTAAAVSTWSSAIESAARAEDPPPRAAAVQTTTQRVARHTGRTRPRNDDRAAGGKQAREGSASEQVGHAPAAAALVNDSAETTPAAPLDPASTSHALAEAREIGRAEKLLATAPETALSIVQRLQHAAGPANLREERDYIEVLALHLTGAGDLSKQRADAFLRSYPHSAFAKDVRQARQGAAPAHE